MAICYATVLAFIFLSLCFVRQWEIKISSMLKFHSHKFITDKTSINNGGLQAYLPVYTMPMVSMAQSSLFSSHPFPQHQSIIPQPLYITLSFHVTQFPDLFLRNQAAHQFLAGNSFPARNDTNILNALLG
jgi:hypothetical protein